jgi:predicted DNA-binding transcriptional regulator AlpA
VGQKVNSDDLIGAADVAVILRLSHPSSVTTYLRRYSDFPRPVVDLSASRVRLWRRQDIERWHRTRTVPS